MYVPAGLSGVVAIAMGYNESLALRDDGTVIAWDRNNSTLIDVPTGLTNVIALAAGGDHTLALVGDGPLLAQTRMANPRHDINGFSFSVPSQSGRVYLPEFKNSLTDDTWRALPLVAGNGGSLKLVDSNSSGAQRFYRVRRW
jgi:hypothetical protein